MIRICCNNLIESNIFLYLTIFADKKKLCTQFVNKITYSYYNLFICVVLKIEYKYIKGDIISLIWILALSCKNVFLFFEKNKNVFNLT